MDQTAKPMTPPAPPAQGHLAQLSASAYLFGALLLVIPDVCLFLLIMPWWKPGLTWYAPLSFFLIDAAIGMLAVFLIRICRQKGIMGDLILVALRTGQMTVVYAVKLALFAHDTLNLLMFILVPFVLFAAQVLGMRLHLSDFLYAQDPAETPPPTRSAEEQ